MPNGQNRERNAPETQEDDSDGAANANDADELEDFEEEEEEEERDPFGDLVASMDAGERLILKRSGPSNLPQQLRGYLETIEVGEGAEAPDIFDLVKNRWGGGTYILQRAHRPGGTRRGFAKGAAVLHIGGPPLYEGRSTNPRTGDPAPLRDERDEKPRTRVEYLPAPAPAPTVNPDPGVVAALTSALVKMRAGGQELGLADVITLAQQLQPNPAAPRTPISELKQHVAFLGELKALLGSGDGNQDAPSSDGVPKSIEDAFMQFFRHQGAGALFGNAEQPAQAQQGVPASGPPGALWDPQRRVWVWPQARPLSPQEAAGRHPTPPPGLTMTPPQAQAPPEPEDEWEEEPITPEMVSERLRQLDATERREFLRKLQAELGPSVVETFRQSMSET